MEAWAVPLAALIVSLATLTATGLNFRRTATRDQLADAMAEIRDLRAEIRGLKKHAEDCDDDRLRLERERVVLLERLGTRGG